MPESLDARLRAAHRSQAGPVAGEHRLACGRGVHGEVEPACSRQRFRPVHPGGAAGTDRMPACGRGRDASAAAGAGRRQPRRLAAPVASFPPGRIHPLDLARRDRRRCGRYHPCRQHRAGGNLSADRAVCAGSRIRTAFRRRPRPERRGAAAGGVRPRQARWRRAQLQFRHRPRVRLRARGRVRWRTFARCFRLLRAARPATGEAAGRSDCGRVLSSRRSALAPVRQCRTRRPVVRGDGALLPARRPRLGALCLAEGATRCRRHRRRRMLPRRAAAVRVPALSRLRRARRSSHDEGGDRRGSRAQGHGR